jgi:hypothetical protein
VRLRGCAQGCQLKTGLNLNPRNTLNQPYSSVYGVQVIVSEVEASIRAGGHHAKDADDEDRDRESGYFEREYPTLHGKGASFYSSPSDDGPYLFYHDRRNDEF